MSRRVLFEGTRAVGVQASQLGQEQQLRAEREVILCGGAYNSPQLLMLSGIGPAEHLTMREIEVLLDRPAVGENLSDHAATELVWTTPEPESLLLAGGAGGAARVMQATQTGPFASGSRRGRRLRARRGGRAGARHPVPLSWPCSIVEEGMSDPASSPRRVGVALPVDAAQQGLGATRLQ